MSETSPPKKKNWSWRSQAFRGLVYQALTIIVIAVSVLYLANNTATNMKVRGIQSGFDFLTGAAGFDIGESLYAFDSGSLTGAPTWSALPTRCALLFWELC
jgi:general L-amino acid transport system permease protein